MFSCFLTAEKLYENRHIYYVLVEENIIYSGIEPPHNILMIIVV
jgi:hypothetical protein